MMSQNETVNLSLCLLTHKGSNVAREIWQTNFGNKIDSTGKNTTQ